jgi:hypothetical protein
MKVYIVTRTTDFFKEDEIMAVFLSFDGAQHFIQMTSSPGAHNCIEMDVRP